MCISTTVANIISLATMQTLSGTQRALFVAQSRGNAVWLKCYILWWQALKPFFINSLFIWIHPTRLLFHDRASMKHTWPKRVLWSVVIKRRESWSSVCIRNRRLSLSSFPRRVQPLTRHTGNSLQTHGVSRSTRRPHLGEVEKEKGHLN